MQLKSKRTRSLSAAVILALVVLCSQDASAAKVNHAFVSTPESGPVSRVAWNEDHSVLQLARTITGSYSVQPGDDLIVCQNTSGASVVLPAPNGQHAPVTIFRPASSAAVTAVVASSGTIETAGVTVTSLALTVGTCTFHDAGTSWTLVLDQATSGALAAHAALTSTAHGGLLPAGTTTAGVPDSTDRRYLTDAQRSGLAPASAAVARLVAADQPSVPLLIIDADFGQDVDDLGALAVAHRLADLGECRIIATSNTYSQAAGAAAIDAVNTFYGRASIPVGLGGTVAGDDNYRSAVAAFPNRFGTDVTPPSGVSVYRRALASAPDSSVVWYVQGPMTLLSAVYNSGADSISPLTGAQLMAAKLRELVVLGGIYPGGGAEYDFYADASASQVINQLSAFPITFQGFEVGSAINTRSSQPLWSPIRAGYEAFFTNFGGATRDSWGALGVIYAVRGVGSNFTLSALGTNTIAVNGNNTWTTTASGHHRYLIKSASDATLTALVTSLQDALPKYASEQAQLVTEGYKIRSPLNIDVSKSSQINFWNAGSYKGTVGFDDGGSIITGAPVGALAIRGSDIYLGPGSRALRINVSDGASADFTTPLGTLKLHNLAAPVADSDAARKIDAPTTTQKAFLDAAESTITWVANNFDPTVSGLAGSVGAVASTYDQKKAWKRWGTDGPGVQWGALHTTSGSLAASASVLNIPVYGDTLGGFTVDIANLQSDTGAADHPHIVPLVNGTAVTVTNTQKIGYTTADIYAMVDLNLVGGFGVWFDSVDTGIVRIECLQPQSSLGPRLVRFHGIHYKSAATNKVVVIDMDAIVPSGEITSVGVGMLSTSGNAKFPINTAAWRLERR